MVLEARAVELVAQDPSLGVDQIPRVLFRIRRGARRAGIKPFDEYVECVGLVVRQTNEFLGSFFEAVTACSCEER